MLVTNQRFFTLQNNRITDKRETIQQLDVDIEGVEKDEDGCNGDMSLDFHQLTFDYLPVSALW